MFEWEQLVKENESKIDVIDAAFPLSSGLYLPSNIVSSEMAIAVETDSMLKLFPGTKYSLYPEDAFTYIVHGTDTYSLGWIQYMMFRFINSIGWTSYTDPLINMPHIDLYRIVRLMDEDVQRRIDQVKQSNPDGVAVVIQTSDDSVSFALSCLQVSGTLIYMTILPLEDGLVDSLSPYFKDIKVIRPYWSVNATLPIVVVVGISYTRKKITTATKKIVQPPPPTSYVQSEKEAIDTMIAQQKYIASINDVDTATTNKMFVQFLIEGLATWNI